MVYIILHCWSLWFILYLTEPVRLNNRLCAPLRGGHVNNSTQCLWFKNFQPNPNKNEPNLTSSGWSFGQVCLNNIENNVLKTGSIRPVQPVEKVTGGKTGLIGNFRTGSNRWLNRSSNRFWSFFIFYFFTNRLLKRKVTFFISIYINLIQLTLQCLKIHDLV